MNWRVKPTINTIATFKGFKDNEHWNIGEQDTIKSLSIKSFIKTKNPRHFFKIIRCKLQSFALKNSFLSVLSLNSMQFLMTSKLE